MSSPLEYLLLMMLSAHPDPTAAGALSKIETSSGNPRDMESFIIRENGQITMRTILMEPRDMMAEQLEAPVKVPPEWVPSFKIGSPLKIQIDANGRTYDAKVARIESITDENGSTVQVIAALKNPPGDLEPGMVGTATIVAIP